MVYWKFRRNKKDSVKQLLKNSYKSTSTPIMSLKSCLRNQSSSGESSTESPSDTYKCYSFPTSGDDHRSIGECSFDFSQSSRTCGPLQDGTTEEIEVSRSPHRTLMHSQTQRTPSHCGHSTKTKAVRFTVVEIRDYERVVGDHPSCSAGPPIGIGWTILDSRVVHIDQYETSRPSRRSQLEIVLSKSDREMILKDWGVPVSEIVSSTRALYKAKSQRRQTVRNLYKVQKLEEGIENAAKTLKRVLTFHRHHHMHDGDEDEEEEPSRHGGLLPYSEAIIGVDELDLESSERTKRSAVVPAEITESDDGILEDMEVQVSDTEFCTAKPTKLPVETAVSILEDDSISCISGFTTENSTTASQKEMERFYRELELEMFGEEPVPCMVGKTLDVTIPPGSRPCRDTAPSPSWGIQEPDVVFGEMEAYQVGGAQRMALWRAPVYSQHPTYLDRYPVDDTSNSQQNSDEMRGTFSVPSGIPCVYSPRQQEQQQQQQQLHPSLWSLDSSEEVSHTSLIMNGLDEQHENDIHSNTRMMKMMAMAQSQEDLMSTFATPHNSPMEYSLPHRYEGSRWGSGIAYSQYSRNQWNQSNNVDDHCHMPLASHLTGTTHWMGSSSGSLQPHEEVGGISLPRCQQWLH